MRLFPTMMAFALLSACGKDADGDDSKTITPATLENLQGVWDSTCLSDGGSFDRSTFTIEGTDETADAVTYTDAACTAPYFTVTVAATLSSPGAADTPEGAGKLDLVIQSVSMTANSDVAAAKFNEQELYGHDDWTKGEAIDISGLDKDGNLDPDAPSNVGTKGYDIFAIIDSKLYFGETEGGKGFSEATRPDTLETDGFTKRS